MPVNSFDDYPMTWRPSLRRTGEEPIYREIAGQLEADIRSGLLGPGDKLPPQRELADYLDVNLSTVARAFKLCAEKGLICGETGRGTYIAAGVGSDLPMLDETGLDRCINLGASHPLYEQNAYVVETLRRLLKKANVSAVLEYGETAGRLSHRRSGQRWLEWMGLEVPPERILLTAGLQNSLAVAMTALLRSGDKLAVSALTYPGVKKLAGLLGVQLLPVPCRRGGLDLEVLDQLCRNEGVRGLYVSPDHHNPTAATMDSGQRAALAELIRRRELLCLEDGTYSFLSPAPLPPLAALAPEQCVYLSTVSNALSAGLRIAFVGMPPRYAQALAGGGDALNVMAPPLEAEVVSQLIDSGLARQMVEEKRRELRRRNRLTERYLGNFSLLGESGAQFRWLELPPGWSGRSFEEAARARGVQVFGWERFAVGGGRVTPGVRLAISSPRSRQELERGLGLLRNLLEEA